MEGSFARYIHGEGIMFKYAKGRSVQSGREFHVYHEIIFFMRGRAEFITEEVHMDISPGTVIVIPKETYHHVAIRETSQNPFVRTAVQYINSNIHRKITIQEIAKECMISPSSLSHIFNKEMNIPLHKFIVKKRLINAYHKILAGEPVTAVAMECGFHDYSGFYKQYKKCSM